MRRRLALVVTRRMFLGAVLLVGRRPPVLPLAPLQPWVGLYPSYRAYLEQLAWRGDVTYGEIVMAERYGDVPRVLRRERRR